MSSKVIYSIIVVLAISLVTTAFPQTDQYVKLSGTILNKCNNLPVPEAKITFFASESNATTGVNGNFYVILETVESVKMQVTKQGFKPLDLNVSFPSTAPIEVRIEPVQGCGGTLTGTVVDRCNNLAIPGAQIVIVGRTDTTVTTEYGSFFIDIRDVQQITLRTIKSGYRIWTLPISLPADQTIRLEPLKGCQKDTKIELELEMELLKINIYLTDIDEKIESLREWLQDPYTGYPDLARRVLDLLRDRNPVGNSIPLEVIGGKYKFLIHKNPSDYLRNYPDQEVLRQAYIKAWKDKNPDPLINTFDEIAPTVEQSARKY